MAFIIYIRFAFINAFGIVFLPCPLSSFSHAKSGSDSCLIEESGSSSCKAAPGWTQLTLFFPPQLHFFTIFCHTLYSVHSSEAKEKHGVRNPIPELTITWPYVYSRVDSNTFTMVNPMPESTLTLCQSRLYLTVRDFRFGIRSWFHESFTFHQMQTTSRLYAVNPPLSAVNPRLYALNPPLFGVDSFT